MFNPNFIKKSAVALLLFISISSAFSQNQFEFRKRIVASTDDAEERQSGGTIDITSSDIELVNDGTTVGNQTVGLRFTNVSIPKDAIITGAYLQFAVDETAWTAATSVNIYGEASDNSATFSTAAFNITTRTKTNAVVAWNNIPVWPTVNVAGADQKTPDIKTVVNEVFQRSNWKEGNAITILINGTGRRNAHAYDGVPASAPELIITYTLRKAPVIAFPIPKNSIWMYHDSGKNLGTQWRETNFVDTNWAFNTGKLGYGEGNEKKVISYGVDPQNKYITTYFRKHFIVVDSTQLDSLLFRILADDGAVVYLNGKEIFRRNMPSGSITYSSQATTSVNGADESNYFEYRVGAKLRNGDNVIAVEVHQVDPESYDLGFDMEVISKKPPMAITGFPLNRGSEWYYNDKGLDLYGSNWTDENYGPETVWDYSLAPIGYGDAMTTTIGYGPNAADKYITTYFRKKMKIDDLNAINADSLSFNVRRDDGVVVFVNGKEVFRQNMPTGAVNYRTKTSSITDGANETTYFTTNVAKSAFKNGINQIAVALHQRDSVSSDIGFDMEIVRKLKPNPAAMGCVDGKTHIGCFTSLTPAAQTTTLKIPTASHSFQMLLKQGTAYTHSSGTIPTNPDFTAYVPKNGSSTNGVVSINHENSPGGVTMAYTHLVDSTQLWVVDSTKRVDFTNVVTTVRNCSGGITPWGTVITSEESVSTADANADGYLDIGWNVEIDPWTAKIKEYGKGKQEKLWAIGRMNHENVVVANDSVTLYQGEDGGTHMVYKFVADKKMDLSEGKLYVLKLNQALVSGEPTGTTGKWVRVPNTTQADRNNCTSLATAVGGTAFNGIEDVEIGTIDKKIYFTAKGLNRVYRFKDADTTFTEFETFVGGKNYIINNGTSHISEPWGSGNDNLTFDDEGNLWVLQDGSRNYIWMVRPDHTQTDPKVELFMSPPTSSEPTGMTFTPDFKYMFMSIQHPASSAVAQVDASGNSVDFKLAGTIVVARKEFLGVSIPIVSFEADTLKLRIGKSVNFEDLSFPLIKSRVWTFDSALIKNSTLVNPKVTYNKVGKFAVKLKASNRTGSDSLTKTNYIDVLPALPTVAINANKTTIYEGETIRFNDASTGLVDSRLWNFGGGHITSSTDSAVDVTYNSIGSYDVSLEAGNNGELVRQSKTAFITVLRKAPIAKFTADKTSITKGETIQLTDVSLNKIENRKWVITGGIVTGNLSDAKISVNYPNPGKYAVKLVVSNVGGKDSLLTIDYIVVKAFVPLAKFNVSKLEALRDEVITLTDVSDNGVDKRKWTLSGATVTGLLTDASVKVSYNKPGKYTIKLWVENTGGKDSLIKTSVISIKPKMPVADFVTNTNTINIHQNVIFADKSSEFITSRNWLFVGGIPASSSDSVVSVNYPNSGSYDVQLTVSNASGTFTKLKTANVIVNDNTTGTNLIENVAEVSFYPNPVVDKLCLNLNLYQNNAVVIKITDLSGKSIAVIKSDEMQAGEATQSFDLTSYNLKKGIYLLNVKIGERVMNLRMIKS